MKSQVSSPPCGRSAPATSGVALVITLILLSVITFLAITFLAVSRRSRGAVTNQHEQIAANHAAESGFERAKVDLIAGILAHSNAFSFGLLVSSNYINQAGFDPTVFTQPNPTNVNFDYTQTGAALTPAQQRDNLGNLWYNPRVPVYITNRNVANSNDFRFYVDLNRDGAFTPTGYLVVTNPTGGFYDAKGVEMLPFAIPSYQLPPPNVRTNYFTGDPQFIGVLERPEFPHSATNKFIYRYAYFVVPAGQTLDLNYIHNHAKWKTAASDGFYRNQGVGSWENNLASLLTDLNTNIWGGTEYNYVTNDDAPSRGLSFQDAASLTRYRYAFDFTKLDTAENLFGANGGVAFRTDGFDTYSAGPLMLGLSGYYNDPDAQPTPRTRLHWAGAWNLNHYYVSPYDLWNRQKVSTGAGAGNTFVDRLFRAQTNSLSSYDRYTFYRLSAQLGTDSAPDPEDKLNLNYVNIGGLTATNFYAWTNTLYGRPGAEIFFTNVVDRLLKHYSQDWRDQDAPNNFVNYTNSYGATNLITAGEIPVFVNGRFSYTPALNRLLQLAANIYDAINPRNIPNTTNAWPHVFRPTFKRANGTNIYIADFVEISDTNSLNSIPLDLTAIGALPTVQSNSLIFGVPLIMGARKGLPNFNEFASETVIQMTRKLRLYKSAAGGSSMIFRTNQFFTLGISNVLGAEFWNSYAANFNQPVRVTVYNRMSYSLSNDFGFFAANTVPMSYATNYNNWPGWLAPTEVGQSFKVPFRTNQTIIQDTNFIALASPPSGFMTTMAYTPPKELNTGFPFPRWSVIITNRVQAIINDAAGRLLDYVQLNDLVVRRDFAEEIATNATALGFGGLWATNALTGSPSQLSDFPGVVQQIEISKGNVPFSSEWADHSATVQNVGQEIANFLAFFTPDHTYRYVSSAGVFVGTNSALEANAPFSPTLKRSIPILVQANDPLVHYMTGDMLDLRYTASPIDWTPPSQIQPTLQNLGVLNTRYKPWGGRQAGAKASTDPLDFNTALKDPGASSSDAWVFPTNKLPNLGWLGRIHRGTPWQTMYLKATPLTNVVPRDDWVNWYGNRNAFDSSHNWPEADRAAFDLFTTALNDNAVRGQLPINQTNLAAWSAVFGGMVALQNTNSDAKLKLSPGVQNYGVDFIEPANIYDPSNPTNYPAIVKLVEGINRTRANTNLFPLGSFQRLGDILAVPELTENSPILNPFRTNGLQTAVNQLRSGGVNDALMEWLPQQMMSLIRRGEPRFVVYSYGQALKPADNSIYLGGGRLNGICTNYQITAETVTRTVLRVDSAPQNPRVVVESYNVIPPD